MADANGSLSEEGAELLFRLVNYIILSSVVRHGVAYRKFQNTSIIINVTNCTQMSTVITDACLFGKVPNLSRLF